MDTMDRNALVMRVKIIALSRIRQIADEYHEAPSGYRRDTQECCDAMYDIIDTMPMDHLADIVAEIYHGYAEVGMADEGYTADSLMTLALAMYQDELGERTIYDMGWDKYIEAYFRTAEPMVGIDSFASMM